MIDGVLMVFPCGYNVHRLVNYIFWGGVATKSPPLVEQVDRLASAGCPNIYYY